MPVSLSASIHPWLSAWLLPLPHPYFSVSDPKGEIRIDDIPPGKWEFQVWHERTGYLNAKDWQKGRFTLEIKPGNNDLGLVLLDPAIFKLADDAEATAPPESKTDATAEQSTSMPDDLDVRLARAAAGVAKLAWEKAVAADRDVKGSVSQLEIKKLELEFRKAELLVEKAILDQKIAQLKAEAKAAPKGAAEWKIPTNMGTDEQSGRQYIDKANELNFE